MSDQPRFAICCICETPLVPTFIYSGAEWYCVKCGREYPYMSCEKVDWREDLAAESDRLNTAFRELTKDCIPRGARKRDCEKCSAGEYHLDHATDEELQASLRGYQGVREYRPQLARTP